MEDSKAPKKNNFPDLDFVSGKRFTGRESEEEYKSWLV